MSAPAGPQGMWHVSFTVSDLERSLAFYVGELGLELVHRQRQADGYTRELVGFPDAELEVAMLTAPGARTGPSGHLLELVEYRRPAGARPALATNDVGVAHLAFVVAADLAALHARLAAAGTPFTSPPVQITAGRNQGGWTCYLRDPDGIPLELVQPPPLRSPTS